MDSHVPSLAIEQILAGLNPQQRTATCHGRGPLLIVAGAGTGKTATLVHRVAWLIAQGADPRRILLMTFTRRAAEEMLRRVDGVLRQLAEVQAAAGQPARAARRVWGGTFHAIATRLLRRFGETIGLASGFAVHDRADSEDLLAVVRTELGLAKTDKRFPQKGTCMAIYSHCVNSRRKLGEVLVDHYPWCQDWEEELKRLFDAYVDRKEAAATLDYDDLLLYWQALASDPAVGPVLQQRFDWVLVDEYQDTNRLQAEILYNLCPGGAGLTVVGDDAQSIYSFRAATVRNILDFPQHYSGTTIVTLEQNYRSTQPILVATNAVIAQWPERFTKNLWSQRTAGQRPALVACQDEDEQTELTIRGILAAREQGILLRRQAVLFRASHHSLMLEAELARRRIPFHKYGGLKFIETAHVKDLMAFLRLADNPRDVVAGTRILPLLPGIGPKRARQLMVILVDAGGRFDVWRQWKPPEAAADLWRQLVALLEQLAKEDGDLPGQVLRVRNFYSPLLDQLYDHPQPRRRDLEQIELISHRYRNRRRMLLEMALDPPGSTQDLPGDPLLDDDYLVLSTIHSAKGLEWDCVHVIHATDGNIPSDMATAAPDEIEEERRLFYVALTRAKTQLYVYTPLRYYQYRPGVSDRYGFAQRTRFLPPEVAIHFDLRVSCLDEEEGDDRTPPVATLRSADVRQRTKGLWAE